jgi:hypothetical protein
MDLLIAVVGNAVADAGFRDLLWVDPVQAISTRGFRLTKGEVEMLMAIFKNAPAEVRNAFKLLDDQIDDQLGKVPTVACTGRPCKWSVYYQ